MATFSTLQEAKSFFTNDHFATDNGFTLEALTEDGAVCAFTFAVASVNAHRPTVAQQVSLSFLNASKGTRLISTATCIKSGRSSCVYRIDIKDDLGKDIAQAMFTGFKL